MSEAKQTITFDDAGTPTHVDGLLLRSDEAEVLALTLKYDPEFAASASDILRSRASVEGNATLDIGRKIAALTDAIGKSSATEAKEILAHAHAEQARAIVRLAATLRECAFRGVDLAPPPRVIQAHHHTTILPSQNETARFQAQIEQWVEVMRPHIDSFTESFDTKNRLQSLSHCLRSLEIVRRLRAADLDPALRVDGGVLSARESMTRKAKPAAKVEKESEHDHIDLQIVDCFLQNEVMRTVDALLVEPDADATTQDGPGPDATDAESDTSDKH